MSNKEQILKESFMLFLKHGYEAVSLVDIEKASGVSRGGIYHHFKSKESIFVESIGKFVFEFLESSPVESMPDHTSISSPLLTFLSLILENIEHRMKIFHERFGDEVSARNLFALVFYLSNNYPNTKEKIRESSYHDQEKWVGVINESIKANEITDAVDVEQLALNFRNIYVGKSISDSLNEELIVEELRSQWINIYNLIRQK
ncbi:helix-turn-helix domain-containing protein [Porphyromonadaceae bacterium W3.11]|nr:helix-turn-helix domain-containing protein [Porphyromonadaceae bacterium W3.11]